MTPKELLQRKPESTSNDPYDFQYHVPEVDFDSIYTEYAEKVTTKFYKWHGFDHSRKWVLASVWFEDKPVLIFQEAGRGISDHCERFIVDTNAYYNMVRYLHTLYDKDKDIEDVVDMDKDIPELTKFYQCDLDDTNWR